MGLKTIKEVLDDHDVMVRNNQMSCPVHEDRNPSVSVNRPDDETGFVHCFTCQWSADAAGLEAALSGRDVGEVLGEWTRGKRMPAIRRVPKHEMRKQLWAEWVELSQAYIEYMRILERDPDLFNVALDQIQGMLDEFNDALRPRDPEEAPPPAVVRGWFPHATAVLEHWLLRWV